MFLEYLGLKLTSGFACFIFYWFANTPIHQILRTLQR